MNRRDFLFRSSFFLAGSALTFPRILKEIQPEAFTPLRRNVGIFQGRGGTIGWLADSNAVVAIDSQFPGSANDFISGIKSFSDQPIDTLINTHHHGDHTAGNVAFQDLVKQIVAHQNVPGLQKAAAEAQNSEDEQAYPDVTYSSEWSLDTGDEIIRLNYYGNAHTGGDSVVTFEKANVVHMGDLVFNRWYPFIDRNGGASVQNWITVLENVADNTSSDTRFIFGHGNSEFGVTGDQSDVLVMRDFLSRLIEEVENGLNAGKSKDEIIQKEMFDEFRNHVSPGARLSLEANLSAVYDELTS
ncbi:MAG TPA: MBL fold metallo-hydrolase [Balneolaceae bacterium]|nr:MBL fold metallo-hydrolase [Balneolaceae bacterium]